MLSHFQAVATLWIRCPRQPTTSKRKGRTRNDREKRQLPSTRQLIKFKELKALHASETKPWSRSCRGCLAKPQCRFRTQIILKRKRVKRVSLVNPFKIFHFLHLFRDAEIISGSKSRWTHFKFIFYSIEMSWRRTFSNYPKDFTLRVENLMASRISDENLRVCGDSMNESSFTSEIDVFTTPHPSPLFPELDHLLRIQTVFFVCCFYVLSNRSVNFSAIFPSIHRPSHRKKSIGNSFPSWRYSI